MVSHSLHPQASRVDIANLLNLLIRCGVIGVVRSYVPSGTIYHINVITNEVKPHEAYVLVLLVGLPYCRTQFTARARSKTISHIWYSYRTSLRDSLLRYGTGTAYDNVSLRTNIPSVSMNAACLAPRAPSPSRAHPPPPDVKDDGHMLPISNPRHPLESHPRPRSLQRFRPCGSSSLQGCCNHLPTYLSNTGARNINKYATAPGYWQGIVNRRCKSNHHAE